MGAITNIADEVRELILDEWVKQGHNLTGSYMEKFNYKISSMSGGIKVEYFDKTDKSYGAIINAGVRADQILYPYARKRIVGLTNWVELRLGLSGKEAISVAYAIATKHAREGMPTPASVRFSQTGKRTGFVEDSTKNVTEIIERNFAQKIKDTIKWQ